MIRAAIIIALILAAMLGGIGVIWVWSVLFSVAPDRAAPVAYLGGLACIFGLGLAIGLSGLR